MYFALFEAMNPIFLTLSLFLTLLVSGKILAANSKEICPKILNFQTTMPKVLEYHSDHEYSVDRGLISYQGALRFFKLKPFEFLPNDIWLDLGIGEGFAIMDLIKDFKDRKRPLPMIIGVTFETGSSQNFSDLMDKALEDQSRVVLYAKKLFVQISFLLPRDKVSLITDVGGIMAYTDDVSRDLGAALSLLRPPPVIDRPYQIDVSQAEAGEMRLVIHEELFDVRNAVGDKVDAWEHYFKKIKNVKVEREETSYFGTKTWAIRIVRTSSSLPIVPSSTVTEYRFETGPNMEQFESGEEVDMSEYGSKKPPYRRIVLTDRRP